MERVGSDILDEMLVLAAQAGDREAVSVLVERWHPTLVRHAGYLLGDPHRGADAAQDAWVSIIRKIGGLRDPARFGAWALRIVTNKCRDAGRKSARSGERSAIDRDAFPARESERTSEDVERLRLALRQLPGEQRALLSLRYVDQLRVPQIAEAMGVPEGTIKSRLHAARDTLRRVLGEDDEAE